MSELTNTAAPRGDFRRRLLITASALALLASAYGMREGDAAEEADRSPLWIELGGQFDQLDVGQMPWSPPSSSFGSSTSPPLATPPPTSVGAIPHVGFDADGKISYQLDGNDWILSASVRYGRAVRGPKSSRDQNQTYGKYGKPATNAFVATTAETIERHTILDFSAGKDFGLGMGTGSRSILNFGVRYAQFSSRLNAHINSLHHTSLPTPSGGNHATAVPYGDADVRHSFTGIGPSVSWDASVPVLGRAENGFSFDWSANGAILFGRQKTTAHIATKDDVNYYSRAGYHACDAAGGSSYNCFADAHKTKVMHQFGENIVRGRQVFVPNIGGLLGISYRKSNAKVSFGYRADLLFGAFDGGIDATKKENVGFYGPFATISIGFGG